MRGGDAIITRRLRSAERRTLMTGYAMLDATQLERINWHLSNWARHHRQYSTRLGYKVSSALKTTGSQNFDDLVQSGDQQSAENMDSIIVDLPTLLRNAVFSVMLDTKWTDKANRSQVFSEAQEAIFPLLDSKNLF